MNTTDSEVKSEPDSSVKRSKRKPAIARRYLKNGDSQQDGKDGGQLSIAILKAVSELTYLGVPVDLNQIADAVSSGSVAQLGQALGIGDCESDVPNGDASREAVTYTCDDCHRQFDAEILLLEHECGVGIRSDDAENLVEEGSNESADVPHVPVKGSGKVYQCEFCPKLFTHKSVWVKHRRVHTGERPYVCDVCGKAFTQKPHYNDHARVHTGEKPWQCPVCEKKCITKSELTRHVRVHTGEKPFSCQHCHIKFARKQSLEHHTRVHTGVNTYKCTFCEETFTKIALLEKHRRLSHTAKDWPFSCDICGKGFMDRHLMRKHVRIHLGDLPYPCGVCERRFNRKYARDRHEILHAKKAKSNSATETKHSETETNHSKGSPVPKLEAVEDSELHMVPEITIKEEHESSDSETCEIFGDVDAS